MSTPIRQRGRLAGLGLGGAGRERAGCCGVHRGRAAGRGPGRHPAARRAAVRLGLGVNFAALTGRLTGAVSARHAPDVSGVSATLTTIGGSVGVAGLGSLYLTLARAGTPAASVAPSAVAAAHAFAVTTATLAGLGVLAALAAYRAARPGTAQAAEQAPAELAAGVPVVPSLTPR
jgi:hypothetical protein